MAALAAFAFGPIGRWLLIGLAFLAWTAHQRNQAADRAREECQAEQLQNTVDEITRQRDAARAALTAAQEREQQARDEMSGLEKERDEIVAELAEAGQDSCRIPDATLDRLRDIR